MMQEIQDYLSHDRILNGGHAFSNMGDDNSSNSFVIHSVSDIGDPIVRSSPSLEFALAKAMSLRRFESAAAIPPDPNLEVLRNWLISGNDFTFLSRVVRDKETASDIRVFKAQLSNVNSEYEFTGIYTTFIGALMNAYADFFHPRRKQYIA